MTSSEERALLEEALIVWRTNQTKARGNVSLNGFADYLGASRSIVSMWMLGERPLTDKYKKKIAAPLFDLVGPKAYEVLQVTPSDADLERLSQLWKYFPDSFRRSILKQGEQFASEHKSEKKRPVKNHP